MAEENSRKSTKGILRKFFDWGVVIGVVTLAYEYIKDEYFEASFNDVSILSINNSANACFPDMDRMVSCNSGAILNEMTARSLGRQIQNDSYFYMSDSCKQYLDRLKNCKIDQTKYLTNIYFTNVTSQNVEGVKLYVVAYREGMPPFQAEYDIGLVTKNERSGQKDIPIGGKPLKIFACISYDSGPFRRSWAVTEGSNADFSYAPFTNFSDSLCANDSCDNLRL